MKHLINLSFLLLIAFLMNGCFLFGYKCKDDNVRKFTEEERELIPYQEGDTIDFVNLPDNQHYQFICTSRIDKERDSVYNTDDYCSDGGSFKIFSSVNVELKSNFKIPERDKLNIHLELATFDNHYSRYNFYIDNSLYESFELYYDISLNKFENDHLLTNEIVDFSKAIFINGIEYEEVYVISNSSKKGFGWESVGNYIPKVDTLYYNSTFGILKIVSKEEKVVLALQ